MADLLTLLRDEAGTLLEAALPSPDETRSLLAALVNRVERLELDVVGELKPAPVKDPVLQPSAANSVASQSDPTPSEPPAAAVPPPAAADPSQPPPAAAAPETLSQAEAELAAAQARVDEIKAAEAAAPPPPPPPAAAV